MTACVGGGSGDWVGWEAGGLVGDGGGQTCFGPWRTGLVQSLDKMGLHSWGVVVGLGGGGLVQRWWVVKGASSVWEQFVHGAVGVGFVLGVGLECMCETLLTGGGLRLLDEGGGVLDF